MANKNRENGGLSQELQKKLDNLMFEFGVNMAAGRKKYKLKQNDVAEMLDLSKSGANRISQMENGKCNLAIRNMIRIADIFGMELKVQWVAKKQIEPRKKAQSKDDTRLEESEATRKNETTGIT